LTAYNSDDGQGMYDIAWTPDAQQILYVRGGDSEFPGRPDPNPTHAPDGVSQNIWIVSATGGEPRKLGEGYSPAVSPAGDKAAFISHGQVWAVGLAPDAAKAKLMFHARGEISSLVWAPDGHALAFVSDRGDHGFIGVMKSPRRPLRYLDPGTANDSQPAVPWTAARSLIREPASRRDPQLQNGNSVVHPRRRCCNRNRSCRVAQAGRGAPSAR
jgi:Tol biopolymer transport system component